MAFSLGDHVFYRGSKYLWGHGEVLVGEDADDDGVLLQLDHEGLVCVEAEDLTLWADLVAPVADSGKPAPKKTSRRPAESQVPPPAGDAA